MGGQVWSTKGFRIGPAGTGPRNCAPGAKEGNNNNNNLIICNLHCWLVPCGGRNLRGGDSSPSSLSQLATAPLPIYLMVFFLSFSFPFVNLSMGSRRRMARAQGGRRRRGNGTGSRTEGNPRERAFWAQADKVRETRTSYCFCFLHFFQSFPRLTFFFWLDLDSDTLFDIQSAPSFDACFFSSSLNSPCLSRFCVLWLFFLCLLFAVSVVIVLYLDLLLLAFWKEGGRGKERVGALRGGGGGGRGSWSHGAFSRTVPT